MIRIPPGQRKHRGFTLIELMIVVAIVAILAAIAVPSYSAYLRRGHRADARAGLLQAAQWMERAATATGVYPDPNGDPPVNLPASLSWSDDTSKLYVISLDKSKSDNTQFRLTAQPRGSQSVDKCGTLTLDSTGLQGANGKLSGNAGYDPDCWRR
jgi:type IV pilus assembly protein PilE